MLPLRHRIGDLRCRIAAEHGISLIEVMVAIVILTVGILALITSFNSAQKLTLTAERRTALVQRAQRQIERLETYSYDKLAMSEAPRHGSGTPDEYVDYNSPLACKELQGAGCFAWNAKSTSEEEPLVVAEGGAVSPTPEEWSAGNVTGSTYSYVTWATDAVCKEEVCPAENDYKRVTVVVAAALPGGSSAMTPVQVSSLIANPNAAPTEQTPVNPLKSITCGEGEKCVSGIGSGNAQSWFLHDSGALEDEQAGKILEPTADSQIRATVAPTNAKSCEGSEHSGCPRPDLMASESPTAEALYDYSTELDSLGATITPPAGELTWTCPGQQSTLGACYGGRALTRGGTECGAEPSQSEAEANFKSEMWVTPPFEEETTLTGAGGLTIYTQTLAGASSPATLCVAFYRVPGHIGGLWAATESTPKLVASTSYAPEAGADWPSVLQQLSFTFEPEGSRTLAEPSGAVVGASGSEAVSLKVGERLGLRIWPAASSDAGISVVYGTAGRTETIEGAETQVSRYPAQLQLNTE